MNAFISIGIIAGRELKSLFLSPLAWSVLAVVQLILAWLFLIQLDQFATLQPQLAALPGAPGLTDIVVAPLFASAATVLLLVTPLLTMRVFSEERRQHTLTLLFSMPLSMTEIVLGKYLGLLALLGVMLVLIALMPLALLLGGTLDFGQFAAGVLGLALLMASFAAVGLYVSTLTHHPGIAAVGSFGILLLLSIVDWSGASGLFSYLSLARHYEALLKGVFNSSDVVYYLLLIVTFLILAVRRLDGERLQRYPSLTLPMKWGENDGSLSTPWRGLGRGQRMDITPKSRFYLRAQHALFIVLLLAAVGLLAWLSTRYNYQADWTANARNTLSESSQALLKEMSGPLKITVYVRERKATGTLLERYQRHKPDLALRFVNPDEQPDEVRAQGIRADGEMLIEYAGRNAHVTQLSEQALTDALMRVARSGERHLAFLGGHGERNPHGEANHDLKLWVNELESKGFNAGTLNLSVNPQIPANTTLLVLAGPSADLLPGEVKLIQDYVSKGGKLLWLADPGPLHGLAPLAEQLGVEFVPGVIVDATTQLMGIERPEFALVGEYGAHPVTRDLNQLTLFPRAAGLEVKASDGWQADAFLQSSVRSWAETGALSGEVKYDAGKDHIGPLNLAVALTRETPAAGAGQQRVVVAGDGDFLSNTYLGNGGNLELGVNIVNWLAGDDNLIAIPVKTSPDTRLTLSRNKTLFIGMGFLLALPLALLGAGLVIWLRRRRR